MKFLSSLGSCFDHANQPFQSCPISSPAGIFISPWHLEARDYIFSLLKILAQSADGKITYAYIKRAFGLLVGVFFALKMCTERLQKLLLLLEVLLDLEVNESDHFFNSV